MQKGNRVLKPNIESNLYSKLSVPKPTKQNRVKKYCLIFGQTSILSLRVLNPAIIILLCLTIAIS